MGTLALDLILYFQVKLWLILLVCFHLMIFFKKWQYNFWVILKMDEKVILLKEFNRWNKI